MLYIEMNRRGKLLIVPVSLDIPSDIYKNVLNGSYELSGMIKDGPYKIKTTYVTSEVD